MFWILLLLLIALKIKGYRWFFKWQAQYQPLGQHQLAFSHSHFSHPKWLRPVLGVVDGILNTAIICVGVLELGFVTAVPLVLGVLALSFPIIIAGLFQGTSHASMALAINSLGLAIGFNVPPDYYLLVAVTVVFFLLGAYALAEDNLSKRIAAKLLPVIEIGTFGKRLATVLLALALTTLAIGIGWLVDLIFG